MPMRAAAFGCASSRRGGGGAQTGMHMHLDQVVAKPQFPPLDVVDVRLRAPPRSGMHVRMRTQCNSCTSACATPRDSPARPRSRGTRAPSRRSAAVPAAQCGPAPHPAPLQPHLAPRPGPPPRLPRLGPAPRASPRPPPRAPRARAGSPRAPCTCHVAHTGFAHVEWGGPRGKCMSGPRAHGDIHVSNGGPYGKYICVCAHALALQLLHARR